MLYSLGVSNHRTIKDLTVVFTDRGQSKSINEETSKTSVKEDDAEGLFTLGTLKKQPISLKRAFYLSCSCFSRLLSGESTTSLDITPNTTLLNEKGIRETKFSVDMRVLDNVNSLKAHRARYEVLCSKGRILNEVLEVDSRQMFRSRLGRISFFGLPELHESNRDMLERIMPEYNRHCTSYGDQTALALPIAAKLLPGYMPLAYSANEELQKHLGGVKEVNAETELKSSFNGFKQPDSLRASV